MLIFVAYNVFDTYNKCHVFYPGGTRDNSAIQAYSFWDNTFSDLGRITA